MNHDRNLPDLEKIAEHDLMAALGMLAAGLAHEMNTPLGAVRCTHSTQRSAYEKLFALIEERAPELAADADLAKLRDVLSAGDRVVETALARMLALVDQMRKFLARECPEPVPYALPEAVDGALLLLDHDLKRRIEVVRDYGELPTLNGFPDPVGQILLNLLLNAAQAIEGEGRIVVTLRAEEGRAVVRMADDGPGVPAEIRNEIFDFGFTTKSESGGTGFGLALSRHLAEKMQGTLELETPAEGGSVFVLRFPLDVADGHFAPECSDGA